MRVNSFALTGVEFPINVAVDGGMGVIGAGGGAAPPGGGLGFVGPDIEDLKLLWPTGNVNEIHHGITEQGSNVEAPETVRVVGP